MAANNPLAASQVPGPGSYSPGDVDAYKAEASPAFSMGQRTLLPQDMSPKPGPGAYEPERVSPGTRGGEALSSREEKASEEARRCIFQCKHVTWLFFGSYSKI